MTICERCGTSEPEEGKWCEQCRREIFSDIDAPRFQKSELVRSVKIKAINANGWIEPQELNTAAFDPGADYHRRYEPKPGGRYLFYSDGRQGYEVQTESTPAPTAIGNGR
jgi:hypothetical protein